MSKKNKAAHLEDSLSAVFMLNRIKQTGTAVIKLHLSVDMMTPEGIFVVSRDVDLEIDEILDLLKRRETR